MSRSRSRSPARGRGGGRDRDGSAGGDRVSVLVRNLPLDARQVQGAIIMPLQAAALKMRGS